MVKQVFNQSKRSAGARTVAQMVTTQYGERLTRYLAGKIMKENALFSCQPKRHKYRLRDKVHARYDNVLKQNFKVKTPNKVWTGDVTYIRTQQGWQYLSVVIDLYARNVVGFALSASPDSTLTAKALRMAYESRNRPQGILFHSDQGCHYSSLLFARHIKDFGMKHSMSRRGNCYDNAPTERFFRSLKSEWIGKTIYQNGAHVRADITNYIFDYYKSLRPHSANKYMTPNKKEQLFYQKEPKNVFKIT